MTDKTGEMATEEAKQRLDRLVRATSNHYFRPMALNRTKCDICTRTAGAPSHIR